MKSDRSSNRIGIYVHIPFCEKKCFYCDFYSIENHSQRGEFVDALIREIELFCANDTEHYEVDTIFFGGGTPSLLSPDEVDRILQILRRRFDISNSVEFTLECNPGTVDREKLSGYRQLGVNRLSFGIQSFFDDELKFLSRIHDSEQAVEAIKLARQSGFENVSLDLIYGLPGQSSERVVSNLKRAIELNTEHISAYNLIVEPGTPLFSAVAEGALKPLEVSLEAEMYEQTMFILEGKGFEHYEISNYARPGFECRHNLKYWNCEEYVGFGPSAHSYLNATRWWNISSLNKYLTALSEDKLPISAKESLEDSQLIDEFVMLQLRQGRLDLGKLKERFMIDMDMRFKSDLEKNGYAQVLGGTILLTSKGFTVCDKIAEELLSLNLTRLPRVNETKQPSSHGTLSF